MLEISASKVKELREKTGSGIMDCKKALAESDGDLEKAMELLRRRGLAKAQEKESRQAMQGKVGAYIHTGGKIGVLVEVNCETDFVANTDEFGQLVKDLAMQVAAANPLYLKSEEIPPEVLEREKDICRAQAVDTGRPAEIVEKMVEGHLGRFIAEAALLEQPFIKDQGIAVKEHVAQMAARTGENIIIRRFVRYALGQNLENKGETTQISEGVG